jgi:NAD(P)-dependent dehydrogenase (short-subunit alcohol dehydrogenase family)
MINGRIAGIGQIKEEFVTQKSTLMRDKIILITGATSGIGKITALELARMGAEIILVSRSEARCASTAQWITRETGNPGVSFEEADLSSLGEIRRLAAAITRRTSTLDVLVNNAGGFFWERELSADGIEMTFALNHLNYFLLTHLMLDLLKRGSPARIINVSSNAHRRAEIQFSDLMGEKSYFHFKAYGQSKLANVLFTYELARRLEGSGVTANALHPGFVDTGFAREGKSVVRHIMPLIQRFAISPEEGAETSIYLASSPEVGGITGAYFENQKPVQSAPESYNRDTARKLWEISAEMTGIETS